MTDLHTLGWRQGSLLKVRLPVTRLVIGEDSEPEERRQEFGEWVVCSQDCDLASASTDEYEALIELRPVNLGEETKPNWGIRSQRFSLARAVTIDATSPRLMVAPRLLAGFAVEDVTALPDNRARAFKTWLGLRYDRPAVPDHLVGAAREVAKRFSSRSGREMAESVHDVLMQFDDSMMPPHVEVYAVVSDDADREAVQRWLSETATRVRPDVCVVSVIDTASRGETSLELLESSYGADLSQLTWGGPDPVGAS